DTRYVVAGFPVWRDAPVAIHHRGSGIIGSDYPIEPVFTSAVAFDKHPEIMSASVDVLRRVRGIRAKLLGGFGHQLHQSDRSGAGPWRIATAPAIRASRAIFMRSFSRVLDF